MFTTKTKDIIKASTNATVLLKAIDLEFKALLQKDLNKFKPDRNHATQQVAAGKRAAWSIYISIYLMKQKSSPC